MTTLELAEKIAQAVLEDAYESGDGFMWETVPNRARAVLQTLDANQAWFCRLPVNADGDAESETETPFPYQPELFA